MPIVTLKNEYKQLLVMAFLIKKFNAVNGDTDDLIAADTVDEMQAKSELKTKLKEFQRSSKIEIGMLRMGMLEFEVSDFMGKLKLFYQLQKFIYSVRIELLKRYHIIEEEFFLEKQARIADPSIEAYGYMGNSNLEVKEETLSYSLQYE